MNLSRRMAIKQFLYASAAVVLIPSCLHDKSKASIILKNMQIDADQEKLLAEIAESIIPTTTTPGAKDVSAHLFALKMIDDCYNKDGQQKFVQHVDRSNGHAEDSRRGVDPFTYRRYERWPLFVFIKHR